MRLAVVKERRAAETRVAATPDTVKKLIGLGLTVAVEAGAGANASLSDAEFAAAQRRGVDRATETNKAGMGWIAVIHPPAGIRCHGVIPFGVALF